MNNLPIIMNPSDVVNGSCSSTTRVPENFQAEEINENNDSIVSESNSNSDMVDAIPSNKTDEYLILYQNMLKCDIDEIRPSYKRCEKFTDLAMENFFSSVTTTSKSLSDILSCSGDNTSSNDSDSESVDLIEDCKSSDSSDYTNEMGSEAVIEAQKRFSFRIVDDSSESDESMDDEKPVAEPVYKHKPYVQRPLCPEAQLRLDQLAPVLDSSQLSLLAAKSEDLVMVALITHIQDHLVTVCSFSDSTVYPIGTLLYVNEGSMPLGYIYDIVTHSKVPIYIVRFSSPEEIQQREISIRQKVFCVHKKNSNIFNFINERVRDNFVTWQAYNFPKNGYFPEGTLTLPNPRKRFHYSEADGSETKQSSLDRHQMFERAMNLKNTLKSMQYK